MIAKGCPKCDQQVKQTDDFCKLLNNAMIPVQVPVACKACPCGHSFFNARRTARVLSPGEDFRRRTQRVRREKPNYYDALEYDKHIKRVSLHLLLAKQNLILHLSQIKLRNSECDDEDYSKKDGTKSKRKKIKKEEDEDDDAATNLTPEKQVQCSLILDELNRKMQLVTWKPT